MLFFIKGVIPKDFVISENKSFCTEFARFALWLAMSDVSLDLLSLWVDKSALNLQGVNLTARSCTVS